MAQNETEIKRHAGWGARPKMPTVSALGKRAVLTFDDSWSKASGGASYDGERTRLACCLRRPRRRRDRVGGSGGFPGSGLVSDEGVGDDTRERVCSPRAQCALVPPGILAKAWRMSIATVSRVTGWRMPPVPSPLPRQSC